MDCYRDMADVERAFVDFMDKVPFYGAVTACIDNVMLRGVLSQVRHRLHTYGESADADFQLRILPSDPGCHARFEVNAHGLLVGPFALHVPGRHNLLNATASVAVGIQLGISPDAIAAGLAGFRGVDRRFQVKGVSRGVTVVDDYGHHPTEVVATLSAAAECAYSAVHVLFQPHRFTRTRDLWEEFLKAFELADSVEIVDIYSAGEAPIPGITAQALAEEISRRYPRVAYADSMEEAVRRLAARAQNGSAIVTLGAGSVSQAGPMLLDALRA
jgi:UDP-N-acetylmuramate--alanine ligase